jgi:arsenate reductase
MKLHPNELFFLYDNSCNKCKKAKAYAYSITPHVNEMTFDKAKFTTTHWRDLLEMLNLSAKDLLNKSHPEYQAKLARHDYDDEGWLNILIKFPHLIKGPIVVMHNKAILCKTPKDVYKIQKERHFHV